MSDRIPAATKALLTLSLFFVCATLGAGAGAVHRLAGGHPVGHGGLCLVQQMSAGFARRRDKRAIAREMAHLRKRHLEFETALTDTRTRLGELGGLIESAPTARNTRSSPN